MLNYRFGEPGATGCFPLKHFVNQRKPGQKLILERWKRDNYTEIHYCRKNYYPVEKGCNLGCADYLPLNKKKGRCKHYEHFFYATGEFYELSIKLRKLKNYKP